MRGQILTNKLKIKNKNKNINNERAAQAKCGVTQNGRNFDDVYNDNVFTNVKKPLGFEDRIPDPLPSIWWQNFKLFFMYLRTILFTLITAFLCWIICVIQRWKNDPLQESFSSIDQSQRSSSEIEQHNRALDWLNGNRAESNEANIIIRAITLSSKRPLSGTIKYIADLLIGPLALVRLLNDFHLTENEPNINKKWYVRGIAIVHTTALAISKIEEPELKKLLENMPLKEWVKFEEQHQSEFNDANDQEMPKWIKPLLKIDTSWGEVCKSEAGQHINTLAIFTGLSSFLGSKKDCSIVERAIKAAIDSAAGKKNINEGVFEALRYFLVNGLAMIYSKDALNIYSSDFSKLDQLEGDITIAANTMSRCLTGISAKDIEEAWTNIRLYRIVEKRVLLSRPTGAISSLVTSKHKLVDEAIAEINRFCMRQEIRREPFVTRLTGEPGVGKSNIACELAEQGHIILGMKEYQSKGVFNNFTEYDDSLNNSNTWILADDANQVPPEPGKPGFPGFLIQACNNAPHELNKSRAEEKGFHFNQARFMICTDNEEHVNIGKTLTCPGAFYRRLHLSVRVKVKDEYNDGSGRLRVDSSNQHLLTMHMCEFQIYQWIDGNPASESEWMSPETFLTLWSARIKQHHEFQTRLIDKRLTGCLVACGACNSILCVCEHANQNRELMEFCGIEVNAAEKKKSILSDYLLAGYEYRRSQNRKNYEWFSKKNKQAYELRLNCSDPNAPWPWETTGTRLENKRTVFTDIDGKDFVEDRDEFVSTRLQDYFWIKTELTIVAHYWSTLRRRTRYSLRDVSNFSESLRGAKSEEGKIMMMKLEFRQFHSYLGKILKNHRKGTYDTLTNPNDHADDTLHNHMESLKQFRNIRPKPGLLRIRFREDTGFGHMDVLRIEDWVTPTAPNGYVRENDGRYVPAGVHLADCFDLFGEEDEELHEAETSEITMETLVDHIFSPFANAETSAKMVLCLVNSNVLPRRPSTNVRGLAHTIHFARCCGAFYSVAACVKKLTSSQIPCFTVHQKMVFAKNIVDAYTLAKSYRKVAPVLIGTWEDSLPVAGKIEEFVKHAGTIDGIFCCGESATMDERMWIERDVDIAPYAELVPMVGSIYKTFLEHGYTPKSKFAKEFTWCLHSIYSNVSAMPSEIQIMALWRAGKGTSSASTGWVISSAILRLYGNVIKEATAETDDIPTIPNMGGFGMSSLSAVGLGFDDIASRVLPTLPNDDHKKIYSCAWSFMIGTVTMYVNPYYALFATPVTYYYIKKCLQGVHERAKTIRGGLNDYVIANVLWSLGVVFGLSLIVLSYIDASDTAQFNMFRWEDKPNLQMKDFKEKKSENYWVTTRVEKPLMDQKASTGTMDELKRKVMINTLSWETAHGCSGQLLVPCPGVVLINAHWFNRNDTLEAVVTKSYNGHQACNIRLRKEDGAVLGSTETMMFAAETLCGMRDLTQYLPLEKIDMKDRFTETALNRNGANAGFVRGLSTTSSTYVIQGGKRCHFSGGTTKVDGRPSQPGDCGSPVLLSVGNNGLIIGIHSGSSAGTMIFSGVNKADYDEAWTRLRMKTAIPINHDMAPSVGSIAGHNLGIGNSPHEKNLANFQPPGPNVILGATGKRVAERNRMQIGALSGVAEELGTRETHIRVPFTRKNYHDLIFSTNRPVVGPLNNHAKAACDSIIEMMASLPFEYQTLSHEEVMQELDFTTSAGPPYNCCKKNLLKEEDLTPEVMKSIQEMEERLTSGKRGMLLFGSSQKEEMRKEGKSARVFCPGSIEGLYLSKKYFGCLLRCVSDNGLLVDSLLGLDPQSNDWQRLYTHLFPNTSFTEERVIGTDFGTWDQTYIMHFKRWICKAIIMTLSEHGAPAQELIVCERILMEVCEPILEVEGVFIAVQHLFPSGTFFTALMNGLGGNFLLRMSYHSKFNTLERFTDHVRVASLGDDLTATVNKRVNFSALDFNECCKKSGFTLTSCDKSELKSFMTIGELDILKRKFVYFENNGLRYILGAIDPETIVSMFEFCLPSKVLSKEQVAYETAVSALELSWPHGRNLFEEIRNTIIKHLKEIGFPIFNILTLDYDYYCENRLKDVSSVGLRQTTMCTTNPWGWNSRNKAQNFLDEFSFLAEPMAETNESTTVDDATGIATNTGTATMNAIEEDVFLAKEFEYSNWFKSRELVLRSWTIPFDTDHVGAINPLKDIIEHPDFSGKMKYFAWLNGILRVKVRVAAPRQVYGSMLVTYNPYGPEANAYDNDTLVLNSQRPNAQLRIGDDEYAELVINLLWHHSAIGLYNDDYTKVGSVTVQTIAPVRDISGMAHAPTIVVSASFDELELGGATRGPETLSGVASKVASYAKVAMNFPPLAIPAEIIGGTAEGIATIARAHGFARPKLMNNTFVHNRPYGNLGNGEGNDDVMTVALSPEQGVSVAPELIGDSEDPLFIPNIVKKKTIVGVWDWNASYPRGKHILQIGVNPGIKMNHARGTLLTPQAVASYPFKYWNGTMIYTITVVCSTYHGGQLHICHDPISSRKGLDTHLNKVSLLNLENDSSVRIVCNWSRERDLLLVESSKSLVQESLAFDPDTMNGMITISVAIPVNSPAVGVDKVSIVVEVEMEDPFFAMPTMATIERFQSLLPNTTNVGMGGDNGPGYTLVDENSPGFSYVPDSGWAAYAETFHSSITVPMGETAPTATARGRNRIFAYGRALSGTPLELEIIYQPLHPDQINGLYIWGGTPGPDVQVHIELSTGVEVFDYETGDESFYFPAIWDEPFPGMADMAVQKVKVWYEYTGGGVVDAPMINAVISSIRDYEEWTAIYHRGDETQGGPLNNVLWIQSGNRPMEKASAPHTITWDNSWTRWLVTKVPSTRRRLKLFEKEKSEKIEDDVMGTEIEEDHSKPPPKGKKIIANVCWFSSAITLRKAEDYLLTQTVCVPGTVRMVDTAEVMEMATSVVGSRSKNDERLARTYIGESYISFRTLLRRYFVSHFVEGANTYTGSMYPVNVEGGNTPSLFAWLIPLYTGMRGGMRYKVQGSGLTRGRLLDRMTRESLTAVQVMKELSVEFPYYSDRKFIPVRLNEFTPNGLHTIEISSDEEIDIIWTAVAEDFSVGHYLGPPVYAP